MENTQDIIKLAKEELEAVCQKHNIALVPVIVHQGDRTFSSIEIMPRPQVPGISEEAPKSE